MHSDRPPNSLVLEGAVLALDVDGVTLDSSFDKNPHWMTVVSAKFDIDAHLLRTELFERSWPDVVRGRQPIEVALAEVINKMGWTVSVEEILECWFEADYFLDNEMIEAVIDWANQGARIVLATDQEHRRAEFLRSRLADVLPLSGFVYSGAIGYVKEEREFYPVADVEFGTSERVQSVVFVDDRIENIEVACRHGWRGFQFENQVSWRRDIDHLLQEATRGR